MVAKMLQNQKSKILLYETKLFAIEVYLKYIKHNE